MKLPRDLSGQKLISLLCKNWEYRKVHQVGSHVVLETSVPSHHRIAIPNHSFLRIGTLNAILRSVAQHKTIQREEILR